MDENYTQGFENLFNNVSDKVEQFLRYVLLKIHADAVKIIDDNKAFASGEMRKNITEQILREVGVITGVVGVGANVPYAIFRHEGTKPHFPPIAPLMKWVVQKGLLRKGSKPTTMRAIKRSKFADQTEQQLKSVAFLIARKISRSGTVGLPFLRLALNQNEQFIIDKFKTLLA